MEVQLTAREMFEKLGYKLFMDNESFVIYSGQWDLFYKTQIRFDRLNKMIYKCLVLKENTLLVEEHKPISLEELKAINQQCKEMGWDNE